MRDCPKFGKIFGCKFEARYDIGAPDFSPFKERFKGTPEGIEALKPRTYVHDICIRCGKIVPRGGGS